jgi:hypothetical protein
MQRYINNFTDRNGNAIPQAVVSVYREDGTLAALYSDDGVTAQANPMRTDANGEFSFYAADGVYSITLAKNGHTARTLSEVRLFDWGPYASPLTAAEAAAAAAAASAVEAAGAVPPVHVADYTALRAFAGSANSVHVTGYSATSAPSGIAGTFVRDATVTVDNGGTQIVGVHGWRRVYSGSVHVPWFGFDLAAIHAAIAVASAAGGGEVFFPASSTEYTTTAPILVPAKVSLVGESVERSIIHKTTDTPGVGAVAFNAASDSYVNDAVVQIVHTASAYAYNVGIRNLLLKKSGSAAGSIGVYAPRTAHIDMRNVQFLNCETGYKTYDSWMGSMENVRAQACVTGFHHADDGSGVGSGTSMTYKNCWANFDNSVYQPSRAFDFFGLTYSTLIACGADNGTRADGTATYAYSFNSCRGLTLSSGGCEGGKGGVMVAASSTVTATGLRSAAMNGATAGTSGTVFADSNSRLTLVGCSFDALLTAGTQFDWVIQNGATVVEVNPGASPSGGGAFVSYSAGASKTRVTGSGTTKTDSAGAMNAAYKPTTAGATAYLDTSGDLPTQGSVYSAKGAVSATAATPITVYTIPADVTLGPGAYLVFVYVGNSGSVFQTAAIVTSDGVSAAATTLKAGANLTVSVSGLNVQVTSTATATVGYAVLRMR